MGMVEGCYRRYKIVPFLSSRKQVNAKGDRFVGMFHVVVEGRIEYCCDSTIMEQKLGGMQEATTACSPQDLAIEIVGQRRVRRQAVGITRRGVRGRVSE